MSTAVSALKTGDGFAPGVQIGPLINSKAVEKVQAHVHNAQAMGARVLVGGQALPDTGAQFFAPTVLADCQHGMRLSCEETFGPILSVFPFETEAEAIARGNDTEYGLAAYLYTRDNARAWRVAEALGFILDELEALLDVLLALLLLEPRADLAARLRRGDDVEPVAARAVVGLVRDDRDDIAVF